MRRVRGLRKALCTEKMKKKEQQTSNANSGCLSIQSIEAKSESERLVFAHQEQ
ncbi:MAG: hypothetical protein V5A88_08830 [Candidatus Thermoplasmatota archaeon]